MGATVMNRRDFLRAAVAGTIASWQVRRAIAEPLRSGGKGMAPLKVAEARVYLHPVAHLKLVMVQLLTDGGVSGVGEAAMCYGTGATAAAGIASARQSPPACRPCDITPGPRGVSARRP